MQDITCEQEIEKIHEFIDNQYIDALTHFNTKNENLYIDKNYEEFDSFLEYINANSVSFEYIYPKEDSKNIYISSTGYWSYQISWNDPSFEYRFYMNYPLEDEPITIQFSCLYLTWSDYKYKNDIRGIGQLLWDHLEENRPYIIEYTRQ